MKNSWSLIAFLAECAFKGGAIIVVLTLITIFYCLPQLRQTGESLPCQHLASCSTQPYLWLSKYYDETAHLKPFIVTQNPHTVVVVGSSRVWQFRSKMFNKVPECAFYNTGGANDNMRITASNIKRIVDSRVKPELIILGLDFSWFQQKSSLHQFEFNMILSRNPPAFGSPLNKGGKEENALNKTKYHSQLECNFESESAQKTTLVIGLAGFPKTVIAYWLVEYEKISRSIGFSIDAIQRLQKAWRDPAFYFAKNMSRPKEKESNRELYGVRARQSGAGFRNDGSYRDTDRLRLLAQKPLDSLRVFDSFNRDKTRYNIFTGNCISTEDLVLLGTTLKFCNENNIKVIVLLPPLHQLIYRMFLNQSDTRTFWETFPLNIKRTCESYNVPMFNFSNPGTIPGDYTDCFIDWYHGSETMYGALLLSMCRDSVTGEILKKYTNDTILDKDLAEAQSRYLIYGD